MVLRVVTDKNDKRFNTIEQKSIYWTVLPFLKCSEFNVPPKSDFVFLSSQFGHQSPIMAQSYLSEDTSLKFNFEPKVPDQKKSSQAICSHTFHAKPAHKVQSQAPQARHNATCLPYA